jgi:coenzyme F420-reducing hydrogenase delta subunit
MTSAAVEGNLGGRRRVEATPQTLDEIGLGRERLRMVNLSASEAPTFVARIEEMAETARSVGPNPLRASAAREESPK